MGLKIFTITKKSSGQALVQALMLTLIVGGLSSYIISKVNQSQRDVRIPRIKSEMSKLEAKFRANLTHRSSFDCTNAFAVSPPDFRQCTPLASGILPMSTSIRGCAPATPGAFCGVTIQFPGTPPADNSTYVAATNTIDLTVEISYNGTELDIAKRQINIKVPVELFNSAPFTGNCPPSTPIFRGFDKSGQALCYPMPANCPPGTYLEAFQPGQSPSMMYKCTSYTGNINCGPGQIIKTFTWNGGNSYSFTCVSKENIFSYFGTPSYTVGPAGSCPACAATIVP